MDQLRGADVPVRDVICIVDVVVVEPKRGRSVLVKGVGCEGEVVGRMKKDDRVDKGGIDKVTSGVEKSVWAQGLVPLVVDGAEEAVVRDAVVRAEESSCEVARRRQSMVSMVRGSLCHVLVAAGGCSDLLGTVLPIGRVGGRERRL